ncbi:PPC domain-containing protein [Thalassotalea ganghwensis]
MIYVPKTKDNLSFSRTLGLVALAVSVNAHASDEVAHSVLSSEQGLTQLTQSLSPDLSNNTTITVSGGQGEWQHYSIALPAWATDLLVTTQGGSGDGDLYLRFNQEPTLNDWDCRPYADGNDESCRVDTPSPGNYFVSIRGYRSFSNVQLSVSYDEENEPRSNELENGQTVDSLGDQRGNWQYFTFDVPENALSANVIMEGGSGDADLYVRFANQPDKNNWDCRPYRNGNSEQCNFESPSAGTYHIGLNGYLDYDNVSLVANYVIDDNDDDDNPPATGYCYSEDVNFTASLSQVKANFTGNNWLQTIKDIYQLRWPSGVKLVTAQQNDQYFDQFVKKESFNKLAESLMVAIHEETHMYDLDASRSDWNNYISAFINEQWQPEISVGDGFPRNEILSLIQGDATKTWDDLYLRDAQLGEYKMQGVLTELNAGLTGLIGVGVVGEFVEGVEASNAQDSAAAYMYHLQLYLRQAKANHVGFYNEIKADQKLREFFVIQWLRLHYYLDITKQHDKLKTNIDEILTLIHQPQNVQALEEFTGYSFTLEDNANCLSDDQAFNPSF